MERVLTELVDAVIDLNNRDYWDYVVILAPIVLSFVAIIISLWNSVWSERIKKIEAFMVWDDLRAKHFILIKNSCKKSFSNI